MAEAIMEVKLGQQRCISSFIIDDQYDLNHFHIHFFPSRSAFFLEENLISVEYLWGGGRRRNQKKKGLAFVFDNILL